MVLKENEEILKSYRDLKNVIDTAFDDGEAKGKAEGRLEGKLEGKIEGRIEGRMFQSVKTMFNTLAHFPTMQIEMLSSITDIDVETLKSIRTLLHKENTKDGFNMLRKLLFASITLTQEEEKNIKDWMEAWKLSRG